MNYNTCRTLPYRGTTTVEFSVILPLFFLVRIGGMQIFRYTVVANTVETAVIEAARQGMISGRSDSAIKDVAKDVLDQTGGLRSSGGPHPIHHKSAGTALLWRLDSISFLNDQFVSAGPAEPIATSRMRWNPMPLLLMIGQIKLSPVMVGYPDQASWDAGSSAESDKQRGHLFAIADLLLNRR